jgi:hypothetical protein
MHDLAVDKVELAFIRAAKVRVVAARTAGCIGKLRYEKQSTECEHAKVFHEILLFVWEAR